MNDRFDSRVTDKRRKCFCLLCICNVFFFVSIKKRSKDLQQEESVHLHHQTPESSSPPSSVECDT